jgi:hypothetical protein
VFRHDESCDRRPTGPTGFHLAAATVGVVRVIARKADKLAGLFPDAASAAYVKFFGRRPRAGGTACAGPASEKLNIGGNWVRAGLLTAKGLCAEYDIVPEYSKALEHLTAAKRMRS